MKKPLTNLPKAYIAPVGRRARELRALETNEILHRGHGSLGKASDSCIQYADDNGYEIVENPARKM